MFVWTMFFLDYLFLCLLFLGFSLILTVQTWEWYWYLDLALSKKANKDIFQNYCFDYQTDMLQRTTEHNKPNIMAAAAILANNSIPTCIKIWWNQNYDHSILLFNKNSTVQIKDSKQTVTENWLLVLYVYFFWFNT